MEMKMVQLPIGKINPYENNPRNNEDSVEAVANSIQQFGIKVPMVVDSKNVLVAGHTRLLACKRLIDKYGSTTIPMVDGHGEETGKQLDLSVLSCVMADDLTPEQVKAFRIADNKVGETSTWNDAMLDLEMLDLTPMFDMSLFGFPTVEIEEESKKKSVVNVESMEIKAFEHWDYIVFVFNNQMDWLNVANEFNLHKVNAGYGTTKKVGIGRVIDGKRLLEALRHQSSDTEQGQK